jgi:(p)ppGpp synthase/HD superfamily hydrolase
MLARLVLARRRLPDLMAGLPKTQQGLAYAERAHSGQRREIDGAPFIHHPREVAALLYYAGAPDHVVAAGALHDTVEKTTAEVADLSTRFGARITHLVLALTENEQIPDHDERKAAAREQAAAAGEEALMILAADKISKARELKLETATARRRKRAIATPSRLRRLDHYQRCLRLLEQRLPHSPLVAGLRAELEQLPDPFTRQALVAGSVG